MIMPALGFGGRLVQRPGYGHRNSDSLLPMICRVFYLSTGEIRWPGLSPAIGVRPPDVKITWSSLFFFSKLSGPSIRLGCSGTSTLHRIRSLSAPR